MTLKHQLAIRSDLGACFELSLYDSFPKDSYEWLCLIRNRRSWLGTDQSSVQEYEQQAKALLIRLGLPEQNLQDIANAQVIEVTIPFEEEELSWPVRILPWETLLVLATRSLKTDGGFVVVRHLVRSKDVKKTTNRQPKKLLFIQSAPGRFQDIYYFDTECKLVQSIFNAPENYTHLLNPTLEDIRRHIHQNIPDVVHLSGIDTYQGLEILDIKEDRLPELKRRDGIWLKKPDAALFCEPETSEELASALCAEAQRPQLFICNANNSASRICSLAVAEGVASSLGFQDEIDDSLAELFLTAFYSSWRTLEWNLLGAFSAALKTLQGQSSGLKGAGIVLWSDRSLLMETLPTGAGGSRRRRRAEPVTPSSSTQIEFERINEIQRQVITDKNYQHLLEIKPPRPVVELNYSLLHNNRNLFEAFNLVLIKEGTLRNVRVRVELFLGNENAYWDQLYDVRHPGIELQNDIRIPLVSKMIRSLRERVHTTLSVDIKIEDEQVFLNSYRVILLPVDEWQDNDANRKWLPSFVRPNDKVIRRIVDMAQKYLCVLADSPNVGFDGYQSVGSSPTEPFLSVDQQVQSIWWTLLQDIPLRYINPPPSFTSKSQRLRTPSDIVEGGRGTCIDLALLLASCLEYVEIYPVIFLLKGHAFPGYCRSEESHQQLRKIFPIPVDSAVIGETQVLPTGSATQDPWVLSDIAYPKLLALIQKGELVPLETVWLTEGKGFWEAIEEGTQNLRSQFQFEALFDIHEARKSVTPLPIEDNGD